MKTKLLSSYKKSQIRDEDWDKYDQLKKEGKVIEANKLKEKILSKNKWKKPCHHVAGEVN